LAHIQLPTLILAAHNDPLVPAAPLEVATLSASTHLHIAAGGGHLGFIGGASSDPDRRWMDWRVVDWVMQLPSNAPSRVASGAAK
jgi:predicted alpha/beta-fold hydrolase